MYGGGIGGIELGRGRGRGRGGSDVGSGMNGGESVVVVVWWESGGGRSIGRGRS